MDGRIWMPYPQTIGGLPCPAGLVSTLESCVESQRDSSATGAEVNASVSSTPVRVRSTVGPPAVVFITDTVSSVPISVEARYSEGVLDARLGSVSASSVSSSPVEDPDRRIRIGCNVCCVYLSRGPLNR